MQDAASGLNPDLEPPWEHKEDVLYWSGSSTGMHATTENWRTGHRQRLATDLSLSSSGHRNVTLLELGDYGWTPQSVGFARLSHLFDVSIRGIVQCDEPAYAAMSAAFPSSVNDPASKAFEHKFVLDIDGNTWSGRYHRLLRSRSCVFKMTIFREAQDAHLEPWVHYGAYLDGGDGIGRDDEFLYGESERPKDQSRYCRGWEICCDELFERDRCGYHHFAHLA